jgi:hypothetical protein
MNREPTRNRTVDCPSSFETTPIPQRASSRQNLLMVKRLK